MNNSNQIEQVTEKLKSAISILATIEDNPAAEAAIADLSVVIFNLNYKKS